VAFGNYEDMTGINRLNILECQSVFRFIDDADRQFASDEFTENAGFQINCRHFSPIFIRGPPHNITSPPSRRRSFIARCPVWACRPKRWQRILVSVNPQAWTEAFQDRRVRTKNRTGFHIAPTQWTLRFRNRALSSSNPILVTHLANLSVREVDLEHVFG